MTIASSRGDACRASSATAGGEGDRRLHDRERDEFGGEDPSAKLIGHRHLQQHVARDPEDRSERVRDDAP